MVYHLKIKSVFFWLDETRKKVVNQIVKIKFHINILGISMEATVEKSWDQILTCTKILKTQMQ